MAVCEGREANHLGAACRIIDNMTIKVLHLIDSGGLYGAEMVLLNLVEAQIKDGLSPLILSIGEPGILEKPLEAAARSRSLPVKQWRMRPGLNLSGAWKILMFARREGFQILHSHGYKFNLQMGVWPRFLRQLPVLTTVHGYVTAQPGTRMWLYQQADRRILKWLERVVFVSHAMLKQPFFNNLKLPNAVAINNGMDLEREVSSAITCRSALSERGVLPNGLSRPIIGAVGRLAVEKGFLNLIDAFSIVRKKHPDATLVIVGEGELRETLEHRIEALDLTNCIYLPGFVSPIYSILKELDVFVLSSFTEGLPTVVLEAMLCGTRIAASAVGGVPELLDNGRLGKLFNPTTISEMVEAILNQLADEGHDRVKQRESFLPHLRSFYSLDVMAGAYTHQYKSLLKSHA